MNIVIDPNPLIELGSKHPYIIALYLIKMIGWIPIVFVIIWGVWLMWIHFIQDEFVGKIKFILLAIDVPKNNEQTPKAVEQIFAHLAGAHSSPNLVEQYWDGYVQPWFSLEIISIDGYIQFLIYAPEMYRDLVEAAIYAQYPDAEISEVEDYADKVPQSYPDKEWDIWGTELILVRPDCYPLRTYQEFEHSLSEDMKDPMAALLEMMGRLQEGEQAWIQIIINPIEQKWKEKCDNEVKKIVKEKIPEKKTAVDSLLNGFLGQLNSFATSIGEIIVSAGETKPEKKKDEPYNIVMNLTEGERVIVKSIQEKSAKIGYQCKIRQIYVGKKEVFSKQRGVSGIFGAIKQFNTNDRNSLKPEKKVVITKINYFFKKSREAVRKTKIVNNYRKRSLGNGTSKKFIFNIEELATLWHFPMMQVKAPLIKKAEVKKVEPPFNLPTGEGYLPIMKKMETPAEKDIVEEAPVSLPFEESGRKFSPPENLPFE
ncbi:MAG: hypothetical protein V1860_00910 [bacterium]